MADSYPPTRVIPLGPNDDPDDDDIALDKKPEPTKEEREDIRERERKEKLVREALDRFTISADAEFDQRVREVEDLKFGRALPEDQWPEAILKARGYYNDATNENKVAQEPCLVIDQISQPVRQIVNEAAQARLAVRVKPKGNGASKQEAELRQGIIRGIEVDSHAGLHRMSALDRSVQCGRGYYRIVKKFANDGDWDIDLAIEGIPNQGAVYADPFATRLDKADAEFYIITDDLPHDEYNRRFPDDPLPAMDTDAFTSIGDKAKDWITETHYRIAEYWYVKHEDRELLYFPPGVDPRFPNGIKGFRDDLSLLPFEVLDPKVRVRKVDVRKVRMALINAETVLEETEWEGSVIPIIPTYGAIFNVDGEFVYKGIIANAKDSQRMLNYMSSAQATAIGTSTRSPYTLDPKQIVGLEEFWNNANVENFAYLPAHRIVGGVDYGWPKRNVDEPPIQAITLAIRDAQANIRATTGRHGPSLGELSGERSGKAIRELKMQGELGSSHFLEHLATISVPFEAFILNEMLPHIYDVPGRNARMLGDEEGDEREVPIGVPHYVDDDGNPVPVGPPIGAGAPPEAPGLLDRAKSFAGRMFGGGGGAPGQPMPRIPDGKEVKTYTLRKDGTFLVTVDVGKSYQTQREENAAMMESMMQAVPAAAQVILPIWAKNLDGPAAAELAEALNNMKPGGKDGPDVPPALAQKMQEMQGIIQQLQQAVAERDQALKTESQKLAAQRELKVLELQTDRELAQMKLRFELVKVAAEAKGDAGLLVLKSELARMEGREEHQQEMELEELKAHHDSRGMVAEAILAEARPTPPAMGEQGPPQV